MSSQPIPEPQEIEANPDQLAIDIEKCAICLQSFSKSRSYASNCLHSFCFECLLEWSKIKYNCPLCKRPFDRILFSVKTVLQFKEYQLGPREENQLFQPLEIIDYSPPDAQASTEQQRSQKTSFSKASWIVNKEKAPIEFRMLVYLNEWYASSKQIQYYSDLSSLTEEFGEEITISDNTEATTQPFKIISYRKVKHFRDSSAKWYKNNTASTHRLMEFVHRELKALACVLKKNQSKQPAYLNINMRQKLMSIVINRLKQVNIISEAFLDTIKEFIRPINIAKHFQHELEIFSRSTCVNLSDYDSKCVYYSSSALLDFDAELPSTLPVKLNKYRVHDKPNEAASTQESVIHIEEILDDPESEYSSYCEELEPSPKASPEYICLSSSHSRSRSRSNEGASTSKAKKLSKRKRSKKKKIRKHKSQSRSRSPTRKYSSKRHRHRSRSISSDRINSKDRLNHSSSSESTHDSYLNRIKMYNRINEEKSRKHSTKKKKEKYKSRSRSRSPPREYSSKHGHGHRHRTRSISSDRINRKYSSSRESPHDLCEKLSRETAVNKSKEKLSYPSKRHKKKSKKKKKLRSRSKS